MRVADLENENREIEGKCQEQIDTIKNDNDEMAKKINKLEASLKKCGNDRPKNCNLDEINDQKRELEREKSEFQAQKEEFLLKNQELENEKKKFEDKKSKLEEENEKLKNDRKRLNDERQAYEDLTNNQRFKDCMSNPEPPEDLIEKIESFDQENAKLREEKLKLKNDLRWCLEREKQLNAEIQSCNDNICENCEDEISALKSEVSECDQKQQCCEKQKSELHESLEKCENSLRIHKEYSQKADINLKNCKSKLNSHEASNCKEIETKLSNLNSNFDKLVKINSDLTHQRDEYARKMPYYQGKCSNVANHGTLIFNGNLKQRKNFLK